jgi:hypothetical protein
MRTPDPTLDPTTKGKIVVALCDSNLPTGSGPRFFAEIVEALLTNVETKARSYRKPYLQAMFYMNNYQFILSALRGELAGLVGDESEARCAKGLAKWREVYLDRCVRPLCGHTNSSKLTVSMSQLETAAGAPHGYYLRTRRQSSGSTEQIAAGRD